MRLGRQLVLAVLGLDGLVADAEVPGDTLLVVVCVFCCLSVLAF